MAARWWAALSWPPPHTTVWLAAVAAVGSAAIFEWRRVVRDLRAALEKERRLRLEERRGRTRAEVALRNIKKQTALLCRDNNNEDAPAPKMLAVRPIGIIRTPFPKRAGTPRQGGVAPSARGLICLDRTAFRNLTPDALDGFAEYSHCWLIFEFHANTDDPSNRTQSKVQPPRATRGQRVGWLATRTPHRANPIGLSLVRVAEVRAKRLEIAVEGVDLCDGTPVLDLKPYVPWDAPRDSSSGSVRVPAWVASDDALTVSWSPRAEADLLERASLLRPLYNEASRGIAQAAITELVAQDPRSKREKQLATQKKQQDSRFNVPFAGLEVYFAVDDARGTAEVVEVRSRRPATHEGDDFLCLSSAYDEEQDEVVR